MLTRRDRLERIASAERDRRAGRVDLAVASLGEGAEWPARVVLALARLPEGEGAETREILQASLDAWALETGLTSLEPPSEQQEVEDATPGETATSAADDTATPSVAEDDLDSPIEAFELDAAFAEAEAQVEDMHDANQVAERVLMEEPLGLSELSGDEIEVADAANEGSDGAESLDGAFESPVETDAAWGESPIWPTPGAAFQSDFEAESDSAGTEAFGGESFDVVEVLEETVEGVESVDAAEAPAPDDRAEAGRRGDAKVLATLERWLSNLEKNSAGRTR